MNKKTIEQAINEYNEIKAIIEENKNKTIDEIFVICQKTFCGSAFNFDGELFDIELNRIEATIAIKKGIPTLLDVFDVNTSDDFIIGQFDKSCTIQALKACMYQEEEAKRW